MRTQRILISFVVALMLVTASCRKQEDVKSSASELELAFQTPTAPGSANPAVSAQTVPSGAEELVKTALAAARVDDYASGVIALEAAQRKPGVTAEQVMAVQRAVLAMTSDLATRAANGDQKAMAQLKAIEQTRSQ